LTPFRNRTHKRNYEVPQHRRRHGEESYKGNHGIHDGIIRSLEKRLSTSPINYDGIIKTVEYDIGRRHGECDLAAWVDSTLLLFEVKSTDSKKSRMKAMHQLDRDAKYFNSFRKYSTIYKFYVCKDFIERVV
jgi:hypothetical protein